MVQTADPLVPVLEGVLKLYMPDPNNPGDPLADVWSDLSPGFNQGGTLAAQLAIRQTVQDA